MRLPPDHFMLYGKRWHVRWGYRSKKVFDAASDYGSCTFSLRLVVLHPELKADPKKAWEIFGHELLHAIDYEGKRRVTNWSTITHEMIRQLAVPLGAFFSENTENSQFGQDRIE